MDGDQEAANHAVPVPISKWTEYGDLVRYRWDLSKKRKTTDSLAQEVLEPMLPELNIDPDKNERMLISQSYPVTVDGRTYEATGGYYKSLFNLDAGMIVVDDVSSPATEAPDKPMEDIVPLRQWSDVVFLLWQDYTKGSPGVLRHIFQSVVAIEQSLSIMRQALGETDDFKDWDKYTPMNTDGRTFRPGSDEYYALLYCPNGRGIGWLLTQHKAQMGLLTVSSITVFGQDGEPMLYFKIEPVEQSD
ncbi:hypothetical protein NYO67_4747 [Aspergillus flavus]|nr:hypothetical protein NYO67_4747 [Aspergillus flavus]